MKKIITVLGVLILSLSVLVSGCGKADEPNTNDPALDNKTTLENIMSKMNDIESLSCKAISTDADNETFALEFWNKGDLYKTVNMNDDQQPVVSIYNRQTEELVVYEPESKQALKLSVSADSDGDLARNSPLFYYLDSSYTIAEKTETMNGSECYKISGQIDGGTETLWVDTEYAFLTKSEVALADNYTHTLEYQDVKVNKVSDKEFDLPADLIYKTMD